MNVLFVDDELKSGLKETFLSLGFYFGDENLFPFLDAQEARQFLQENPHLIDLAIIDEKLIGDMSGIQLGAYIGDNLPHIAMVMLTAYANLELCQEAMRIGFCDFLDKSKVIVLEDVLFKELDRISQLPSVKAKQIAKSSLQRADNNWDGYIQKLSESGTGWYAYNRVTWLLISKALSIVPGLEQNQINHVLPYLQSLMVKFFPKEEGFSFSRLRALRSNDRSNALAEKWLPIIDAFCAKQLSDEEEKNLKIIRQRSGFGDNLFTVYLNKLRNDQRMCDQAMILFHTEGEKFKDLLKFEIIKNLHEEYFEKKIVPKV